MGNGLYYLAERLGLLIYDIGGWLLDWVAMGIHWVVRKMRNPEEGYLEYQDYYTHSPKKERWEQVKKAALPETVERVQLDMESGELLPYAREEQEEAAEDFVAPKWSGDDEAEETDY